MSDIKSSMKFLKVNEKIRDLILSGFKLPGTHLIMLDQDGKPSSSLLKCIPYKKGAIGTCG